MRHERMKKKLRNDKETEPVPFGSRAPKRAATCDSPVCKSTVRYSTEEQIPRVCWIVKRWVPASFVGKEARICEMPPHSRRQSDIGLWRL